MASVAAGITLHQREHLAGAAALPRIKDHRVDRVSGAVDMVIARGPDPTIKRAASARSLGRDGEVGRQSFCAADLGQPKSEVLVNRINLFFGTNWTAAVASINSNTRIPNVDLVISCMDTIAARRSLWNRLKRLPLLWMDLGNETTFGQVIIGKTENIGFGRTSANTLRRRVPHLFDLYPSLLRKKDPTNVPSCSVAESLSKQDLFINPLVSCLAAQLIWKLFRDGKLTIHGYAANLASGHVVPMPIPRETLGLPAIRTAA